MLGWNLKSGVLNTTPLNEGEYWSLFNFVFSDSCMKRNTYMISTLNFESLAEDDKNKLIKLVSASCRKNVVGALYNDMERKLYSFDLKADGIVFAVQAYEFMLKYGSCN